MRKKTKPRVLIEPWAMEAIELAAQKRALHMLYHEKRIMGLTVGNIALLKRYYEGKTGKMAHRIKATDVKEMNRER